MGTAATTAAVVGGGALLGGIAGSKQDVSRQRQSVNVADPGALEQLGGEVTDQQLGNLQDLIGQGPGAQDVEAAVQAKRGLAGRIQDVLERGGVPTETQRQRAEELVAPQKVALEQRLEEERERVARLSAQRGRTQDDPILQAKLAETAAEGQAELSAKQSQIAQKLPQQQIGLAKELAGVREGLATQALQNRQTLLKLGSQVKQQGRQFRQSTATRVGTTRSGGGLKGAITGAIGGASAGANVASGFGSLGGSPGANQLTIESQRSPMLTSMANTNQGFTFNTQARRNPEVASLL